jgi:signal transduction histidine kinase
LRPRTGLLDVSLTGIHLVRPVYDPPGLTIVDFAIEYLNPAGQRMTGLSEQPGGTLLGRFPQALATGIVDYYRRVFERGEQLTYEANYQADGLDNYFKFSAKRSGEHLLVSFTDTSDQDRSAVEEALRHSQAREQAAHAEAERQRQRLRHILLELPAQVAINHGPTHEFEFVNPRYQRLFPARPLLGQSVQQALPELAGLPFYDELDRVYQTGQTFYGSELPAPIYSAPADQVETHYYDVFFQALRDAHGHIDGVLNFAYDVTEQVQARQQVQDLNEELAAINEELTATNEELHQSNTRLLRTNADLDTFVYTASHDLKSPITNIEGLLLALREALPTEVQQGELVGQLLALLQDTVARFRTTITHLTDLVRLQQSQQGPAEPVELGPLVEAVCLDLAAEIQAADATVHVALPAGLWVNFAPANLRSVVYNLLSNAVKYRAPERPAQVWVRAERQPGAVELAVQDNGLGLDPTQQSRLFQVFQRLHTHVEGTGVGLYMIKRLIENGGATIAVSSEPGVGTTFTVTFRA